MKASELLALLAKNIEVHGDGEVRIATLLGEKRVSACEVRVAYSPGPRPMQSTLHRIL